MVRGLEKFREFFRNYNGSYVIIGGTACDIAINEAGLTLYLKKKFVSINLIFSDWLHYFQLMLILFCQRALK